MINCIVKTACQGAGRQIILNKPSYAAAWPVPSNNSGEKTKCKRRKPKKKKDYP